MELPPPLVGLRYHWVLPETLDCLILFRGDEGHFLVVHHCNSLCVLLEGEDTVSQSMQTGAAAKSVQESQAEAAP